METLKVMFRVARSGDFKGDVTALFPTLDANPGRIVSYAHVGQHGEADRDWVYSRTRPAKPNEYRDLLKELQGIYGRKMSPEDTAYKLIVRQRR